MAAPFGLGFGSGILGGLSRNAQQGTEDERTQAILMGELLGNTDLLRPEERSLLPTTTEPRSALTSIGNMFTGGNRTGINSMLTLRGILAGRVKAAQQEEVRLKQLTDFLQNSEEPLDEQQKGSLLSSFKNPKVKFFAEIALKNAEKRQKSRAIFKDLLAKGITERIGSTGAQEEGEEATDVFTNRPASRTELAGAAMGIKGLEDDAFKAALAQPREDPTSLIQPGPGSPASIVNRRTGAIRPLAGTERPSPVVNAEMDEYRRLRNIHLRNQNAGVITPKERHAELMRLIPLAQKLVDTSTGLEKDLYQRDLYLYLHELRQLEAARRAGAPKSGATAPPSQGGTTGLPQNLIDEGWTR